MHIYIKNPMLINLKTFLKTLFEKYKRIVQELRIVQEVSQIHTQKLIFFCILNHLIRNLQNNQPKTQILKKLKTRTQT